MSVGFTVTVCCLSDLQEAQFIPRYGRSSEQFPVDFIVEPSQDPSTNVATDHHLVRAVARGRARREGVLRVYAGRGTQLSLGRYHLAPEGSASGVGLFRRHTGGRALPFGDGFIGLSLILPHRSALVSDDPVALSPHQVMNRAVRGVMAAFRNLGMSVYYPGRDVLTVNRRVVAATSFETDEAGVLLFQATIAAERDFNLLTDLLAVVDEQGLVKMEMPGPDACTSLERELGRSVGVAELAREVCAGYAEQFGTTFRRRSLTVLERRAIEALASTECCPRRWLYSRRKPEHLDRHVLSWAQLGAFEAYFSVRQERFIDEILFTGDLIANSPSIVALERELRLCPLDWRAVDEVVKAIYSQPENFILGVGKLQSIADLILRGGGT